MADDVTKDVSFKTKRHMLEGDMAKVFDKLEVNQCEQITEVSTDAIAIEVCKVDNNTAQINMKHKTFGSEPAGQAQE
jgi:hypothetical protein